MMVSHLSQTLHHFSLMILKKQTTFQIILIALKLFLGQRCFSHTRSEFIGA